MRTLEIQALALIHISVLVDLSVNCNCCQQGYIQLICTDRGMEPALYSNVEIPNTDEKEYCSAPLNKLILRVRVQNYRHSPVSSSLSCLSFQSIQQLSKMRTETQVSCVFLMCPTQLLLSRIGQCLFRFFQHSAPRMQIYISCKQFS